MEIEKKLRLLGDPSGQQSSSYWNAWFELIRTSNDNDNIPRSFEWYTDVLEVERLLRCHLSLPTTTTTTTTHQTNNEEDEGQPLRFFHPGNGNSLVPIHLRNVTCRTLNGGTTNSCKSEHVVLDVSDVALNELQSLLHDDDDTSSAALPDDGGIEYRVGNVLEPPLSFPSNHFHVWMDKGLLDALFSSSTRDEDVDRCRRMFWEAHRILVQDGILCVVTMAEDHILQLLVTNWLHIPPNNTNTTTDDDRADGKTSNYRLWTNTLHVHELKPISGTMRPFGFVLRKQRREDEEEEESEDNNNNKIGVHDGSVFMFHELDGSSGTPIKIPIATNVGRNDGQSSRGGEEEEFTFLHTIRATLQESRLKFTPSTDGKKVNAASSSLWTGSTTANNTELNNEEEQRLMLVSIDVKPVDEKVDLHLLHDRIVNSLNVSRAFESLRWYSDTHDRKVDHPMKYEEDGANDDKRMYLRYGKIVPIGFGIHKLVLRCIIRSDEIDNVCDAIMDQESRKDENDNHVQSVDVDWETTVPVRRADATYLR